MIPSTLVMRCLTSMCKRYSVMNTRLCLTHLTSGERERESSNKILLSRDKYTNELLILEYLSSLHIKVPNQCNCCK